LFGLPTILSSGRGVDIYREARDAQKSSFENRGLHDYAVILDTATTAEQLDRIKKTYEERAAGAKNNRKPLFSTRDVKTLSASPAEMDYMATVESVVTEICSVMNVPPSMIGYMQDATLANFETAKKVFWENGMVPLLSRVARQLTHQLAKPYYGDEWVIAPDLSKISALKQNYQTSVDSAVKLWQMGVPFNEINQRLELGFDEIEGGDVGYLGSGLIPANVDWTPPEPAQDAPPPPAEDEQDDEAEEQAQKILARLAYGGKDGDR
jgi:phage portal protein BeeE